MYRYLSPYFKELLEIYIVLSKFVLISLKLIANMTKIVHVCEPKPQHIAFKNYLSPFGCYRSTHTCNYNAIFSKLLFTKYISKPH